MCFTEFSLFRCIFDVFTIISMHTWCVSAALWRLWLKHFYFTVLPSAVDKRWPASPPLSDDNPGHRLMGVSCGHRLLQGWAAGRRLAAGLTCHEHHMKCTQNGSKRPKTAPHDFKMSPSSEFESLDADNAENRCKKLLQGALGYYAENRCFGVLRFKHFQNTLKQFQTFHSRNG